MPIPSSVSKTLFTGLAIAAITIIGSFLTKTYFLENNKNNKEGR
jgi:hypothetical protein